MHHYNECGSGHHSHHGHGGADYYHRGGGCSCSYGCGGSYHGRHFYTREEMLKHLEEYLEQLKAEAKGLEEHINKLKSADKE